MDNVDVWSKQRELARRNHFYIYYKYSKNPQKSGGVSIVTIVSMVLGVNLA